MSNFSLYVITVYFISLASVLLSRFGSASFGRVLAYFSATTAFLLAAFRPDYFPDVDSYETIFEQASSGEFDDPLYWLAHGEPGFKIGIFVLSIFGGTYQVLLSLMAVASLLLLIAISRIAKVNFPYLLFSYLSLTFVTRDLGVVRLSIACHLIVLASLQVRSVSRFLTTVFASLSFQYFVIVTLIAYPLTRASPTLVKALIIFLISLVLGYFIDFSKIVFLLPDKFESYDGTELVAGGSILPPLIRNFILVGVLFILVKDDINLQKVRIWIWFGILSISCYLVAVNILIVAQRFSAYFAAVIPLGFAYALSQKKIATKKFVLVLFVLFINFVSVVFYNDFLWKVL